MTKGNKIRIYNGAVAMITGGASGLGRALGEALAAQGAEVVLADLQLDLAEKAASEIRSKGGKASAVAVDVTKPDTVAEIVKNTYERYGRLDYILNNAGIAIFGETDEFSIEDWEKSIAVNLNGVVYGVQAAYPIMKAQRFGHIVNTASLAGLTAWAMEIAYTATKHAVVGLSKTLRAEASQYGIRVSVLCPGAIQTPLLESGGKYGGWIKDYPPDKVQAMMEVVKPYSPESFAKAALRRIALLRMVAPPVSISVRSI